jgi:hypothetical protein
VVQLPRNSEAAEQVRHHNVTHRRRDCISPIPLGEVAHGKKEDALISPFALKEISYHGDDDLLEPCISIVLVHMDLVPGSGPQLSSKSGYY